MDTIIIILFLIGAFYVGYKAGLEEAEEKYNKDKENNEEVKNENEASPKT